MDTVEKRVETKESYLVTITEDTLNEIIKAIEVGKGKHHSSKDSFIIAVISKYSNIEFSIKINKENNRETLNYEFKGIRRI